MTTATPVVPGRAEGLELLGALDGAGYRDAPRLVRRADGQTLQLTPLLYDLLVLLDGTRDLGALARDLSAQTGRLASTDDVAFLVEERLAPLGVLEGAITAPKANPLLALRCKVVVTDPTWTRRLTAPFAVLFHPFVVWPVLAAFAAVCWFVLAEKGLRSATAQAFESPGLLLAVFALTVASAGFHELGHAAACRYAGAAPGAMGVGLYLVWPAFYTDVDDAYRLPKRDRLRVDLGGLYFNAIVAVAVTAGWWATGVDALLLGVATQLLQMLKQLAPVLRADGYHLLSDLTGVPDLFAHLGPTLRRLLPWHWRDPSPLRRHARWIVTAWVLIVVPVLLSMLVTGVLLFPRLLATAWASGRVRGAELLDAASTADLVGVGAALLQLFALLLPVVGVAYVCARLVTRAAHWLAARHPALRAVAVVSALVVLLLTWWPAGQYQPVQAATQQPVAAPAPTRVSALAMVPRDGATDARPALLLLPDGRAVITSGERTGQVVPFEVPDLVGNTAVAVNTTDGSTLYDVAVALVTVTEGDPVDQVNAATALASCRRCTTVAVAFEVVLVVGQSDVVAPVNAAVAGNRLCVECVTRALATQLVLSLQAMPADDVRQRIEAELAEVEGADPASVFDEVQEAQSHVVEILGEAGLLPDPSPSPSTSASGEPEPSTSPQATPDTTGTTPSPTPTGAPAESAPPSATTEPSPSSSS